MGYRPLKLRGFKNGTHTELVKCVQKYLDDFSQTSSYDSGQRLSEVEAYLQGIEDGGKTMKNQLIT